MDRELAEATSAIADVIDRALEGYLPAAPEVPDRLAEAVSYSIFAGGKRIRPVLAVMISDALEGRRENVIPGACALEMVHTYSLIHDDLPAMDDDDMRRGKPSSHKVFGEAMAILAGDALLTLAFEVAASSPPEARPARICAEIAGGAGPAGMVGGQAADIAADGAGGGLEDVRYIHSRKTAALIRASVRVGAIAAGASEETIALVGDFGEKLGLLFQATDDILDETAETARLGKTAGKDAASGKLTLPAAVTLEGARREARRLAGEALGALEALEEVPVANTMLPRLVDYVLNRSF
ncbi:MAG: polyprenyl synthetase family protein [Planctomycetes bacterium]|nr:polyprenyl synthetase family protein [Planctomycetota bacterium]